MLIPQFSIRWLLMVTVACAVVFSIFAVGVQEYRAGYQGSCWATGVSIGIVSLVVVLLVHAFVFAVVWAFSPFAAAFSSVLTSRSRSPFASAFLVLISRFRRGPDSSGRSPFAEDPIAGGPKEDGAPGSDKDTPAAPIVLE